MRGRKSIIGPQILAVFQVEEGQPKKRLSLSQIQDALPDVLETGVKYALERLRGGDGAEKQIRVVGYQTQVGHGGKPLPIFELGTDPDVPRTDEYVEDMSAEIARRARDVRRKRELMALQKELAAIDNYE
jgi:hypothetical protein